MPLDCAEIFSSHIFLLQNKYLYIHNIYTIVTGRVLQTQQEKQHLKRNNQTI